MSTREPALSTLGPISLTSSSRKRDPASSVYAELCSARPEIRLLQILPKRLTEPYEQIECKLTVHSLDDNPPYTALSYVWGDPQTTLPIIVDGYEVPATTNLVEALIQQREEGILTLWADALCINQADEVEKAQQIQMMGTIYRQALNVVAWLGRSDDTSKRTFDIVVKVYEVVVQLDLETLRRPNLVTWTRADIQDHGDRFLEALCASSTLGQGDLGLVITLLKRPFWTRLWVIQELSLASSARLSCGQYSVDWEVCEAVIIALTLVCRPVKRQMNRYWPQFEDLCLPFEAKSPAWMKTAAAHVSGTLRVKDEKTMSMSDLLEYTCNNTDLKVLDPKDRIYALHGLLSSKDQGALPVDLSISYEELYIRATKHMLAHYGPSLFEYCCTNSQENNTALPSWVVDWTSTAHRDRWSILATTLESPYYLQNRSPNRLVLKAANVGCIVTVVSFSGKLEDALDVIDRLALSSALNTPTTDSLELRVHAWQSVIPGFHFSVKDVGQLDTFVHQRSQVDVIEGDTEVSSHDLDILGNPPLNDRCQRALQSVRGSTLLVTDRGHIANSRLTVRSRVGDVLSAFPGDVFPFVLRQEPQKDGVACWSLVGRALVMEFVRLRSELRTTPWNMDGWWDTNPSIGEVTLV